MSENDYWVLDDKQYEREGLSEVWLDVLNPLKISAAGRLPLGKDRGSTFFLISPGGYHSYHTSQGSRYFWKHPLSWFILQLIWDLFCWDFLWYQGQGWSQACIVCIRSHFNGEKWIINVSGRQYQSLTWQIYFQDRVGHKYLSSVISVCTSACGVLRENCPGGETRYHHNENIRILSCLL